MTEKSYNLKFKKLSIENGRVFKSLDLDLDEQGLVLILGRNGAGKSTIGSLLQAIFFGATPSGHRRDELVKNDSDACFTAIVEIGTEEWRIEYARVKGKWKHSFYCDGKKRDYHGATESAKKAAELLGLTEKEFEGSVHLTQSSQHILIDGKPKDRRTYIADFFGLDERYDQVEQAAKLELAKINESIEKVSNLSHTLTHLQEELKISKFEDILPLETEISELTSAIRDDNEYISLLNKELSNLKLYKSLELRAFKYENPEEQIKELSKELLDSKVQVGMADQIREHNKAATTNNEKYQQICEKINNLKAACPEIDNAVEPRLSELSSLKKQNESVKSIRSEFSTLSDGTILPTDILEMEITKKRGDLRLLQHKLSAIQNGKCSQCGTDFHAEDIGDIKKQIEESLQFLSSADDDLVAIKKRNEKVSRYKQLQDMLSNIPEYTSNMETERLNLSAIQVRKEEYEKYKTIFQNMQKQPLKEEISTEALTAVIFDLQNKIVDINDCLTAKKQLPEKINKTEDELTNNINKISNISVKNAERKTLLVFELARIQVENSKYLKLQDQIKQLEDKLLELDTLKKEQFYWEKLAEAYGSKGLRVQQMQKIMDTVLQRLPYYTSILFEEKGLRFIHKCDSNNIEIYALREGEDMVYEHDISSLSGGEKRSLSAAFVLTLADCISHSKKANILILDEIDSNLDKDAKFRFVNHLLPILKEQYASIFLISHSEELQQAALYDQIWQVKKKAQWSKLEVKKGD